MPWSSPLTDPITLRDAYPMAHIFRIIFFLIGCVIAANCLAQDAPVPRDSAPGQRVDPFPLANLVYQWDYVCPSPNGASCISGIGPGSAISLTVDLFAFKPGSIETWTYYYDFVALVVQGGGPVRRETRGFIPFPTGFYEVGMILSGSISSPHSKPPH
jgi:hypothetical protein